MRITALPPIARPASSRWRPLRLATVEAKSLRRGRAAWRPSSSTRVCGLRLQPAGEGEDAARVHRLRDEAELALDPRLGVGPIPYNDDLRLAGEKMPDAVVLRFGARAFEFER